MSDRAKVNARLDEILARPQQGAGIPEACGDHGPDERCVTCATDDELLAALGGGPVKPCGCLSSGEDCGTCRTDPVNPPAQVTS